MRLYYPAVVAAAEPLELRRLLASSGPWATLSSPPAAHGRSSDLRLGNFQPLTLTRSSIANTLRYAPKEDVARYGVARGAGSRLISLPTPEGSFARFRVVETAIMAPALAAKFPDIKTYAGVGLDDPAARVRLDLTPLGFHAQVLTPAGRGAYYVEPYYHNDQSVYASYYGQDAKGSGGTKANRYDVIEGIAPALTNKSPRRTTSNGATTVSLRTYRLAVAATGEYTAFFGGTVAAGQAAIVTAVNRVSGILETELAIRLQLVANNNTLVYTNASTDPYSNNDPPTMTNQNQNNIDSIIGSANYDIGHVFATAGGGSAAQGVVGSNALKALAASGATSPTGDSFWVDSVAHEMGHQFGAQHTFNTPSSSSRSAANAYEPGSGSTIMSLVGRTSDDIQAYADPFFAWRSIDQILTYVDDTIPDVGTRTALSNFVPGVNGGSDYTIPSNTPFTLTATASDANHDTIYYSWEEADLGNAANLEQGDVGNNPLFRVYPPTTSPSRTFPALSTVLAGLAQTPGSEGPTELLPTTSRTMKFYPVVRDMKAGNGGTNVPTAAPVSITSVAAASNFAVTGLDVPTTLAGLSTRTITWNVAGTTGNGINTANVRILLSTDGGTTFFNTLASSTPNDGSETVTIPNIPGTHNRIKIEAIGNIYFDINNADFTITPALAKVTSVRIDSEATSPQRSRVRTATVVINGQVPTANIGAGAFTLTQNTGVIAPYSVTAASTINTMNNTSTVQLTFGGPAVVGGSVADGRYTLTIDGNALTTSSGGHIDAADNGMIGSVRTVTFHRLFGDVDGDAGVSINDFNSFATAFSKMGGQTGFNAYFDYDADNGISINDFNQFATRFGVII